MGRPKNTKQEAIRDRRKGGTDSLVAGEKSERESADEATNERVDGANDRIDNTNGDVGSLESFRDRPQGHATQNEMNTVHADVTQLQGFRDRNDGFAKLQHDHTWGEVENKPDEFIPRGHGNEAHSPKFVVHKSPKSVPFKAVDPDIQACALNIRTALRQYRDNQTFTASAFRDALHGILHLMHFAYDMPSMSGNSMNARLASDPDYKAVLDEIELFAANDESHYYVNPGPDMVLSGDINVSANRGMDPPGEPSWEPPPEIRHRNTQTATASASSLTIAKPAGVVEGDLLLAVFVTQLSDVSTPSGWSFRATRYWTDVRYINVFYKIATASEPASYTFTANSSGRFLGVVSAYSGVDTSSPIDTSTAIGGGGSGSSSMIAPSVTTTMPGDLVVCSYGFYINGTTASASPPSGMTERADISFGGSDKNALALYDVLQPAAGASGTKTATANASASYAAITVALRRRT